MYQIEFRFPNGRIERMDCECRWCLLWQEIEFARITEPMIDLESAQ